MLYLWTVCQQTTRNLWFIYYFMWFITILWNWAIHLTEIGFTKLKLQFRVRIEILFFAFLFDRNWEFGLTESSHSQIKLFFTFVLIKKKIQISGYVLFSIETQRRFIFNWAGWTSYWILFIFRFNWDCVLYWKLFKQKRI